MDDNQGVLSAINDIKHYVNDAKTEMAAFRVAFSLKIDKLQENVHAIDKNVTALQTRDVDKALQTLREMGEKLEARIKILEDTLMYVKGAAAVITFLYGLAIGLLFWWLNQK